MPINVNCQCYDPGNGVGYCLHPSAPPRILGRPVCVLTNLPSDPRLRGCALIYKHPDPGPPSYKPPPLNP